MHVSLSIINAGIGSIGGLSVRYGPVDRIKIDVCESQLVLAFLERGSHSEKVGGP